MIVSRVASIFLRFGQFVCAAVVLGLVAHFLDQRNKYGVGPLGRSIYTIVIASISVLFSLVWLIPTTASMLHYPFDLLMSAAWFAAFGVLVNWVQRMNCGGIWHWGGIAVRGDYCGEWRAAQAFSFISAIFWFASFILGVIVYHKLSRRTVATDGTHRRGRWHRSRV
ncbi:hypothetical protein K505DRAFT_35500 [Melanomma pulvis-pyrius CBS 109.77]|uniref:MARVEL domain-containing protein n=1 Tax=Melanomma pulvis-pyrius CBS 109.77 TaxID=1314802 RepID=A0A6A6XD06_9PLEO|nr:hypothetical protein K505DRAFT_35500 [Melanomma pulvis-pyrius CBS 109.77]